MSPANRRTVPMAMGRRVRQRARHRCGYCLCSETLLGMPMEFDHLVPLSRTGQGTAKALTILNGVQALEIFRVGVSWLNVEIDEDRPVFL